MIQGSMTDQMRNNMAQSHLGQAPCHNQIWQVTWDCLVCDTHTSAVLAQLATVHGQECKLRTLKQMQASHTGS